jgi:hypothetical protein
VNRKRARTIRRDATSAPYRSDFPKIEQTEHPHGPRAKRRMFIRSQHNGMMAEAGPVVDGKHTVRLVASVRAPKRASGGRTR